MQAGSDWLRETGSRAGLTRLIQGRCGEDTEQGRANEGNAGQVRGGAHEHRRRKHTRETQRKPKPGNINATLKTQGNKIHKESKNNR